MSFSVLKVPFFSSESTPQTLHRLSSDDILSCLSILFSVLNVFKLSSRNEIPRTGCPSSRNSSSSQEEKAGVLH